MMENKVLKLKFRVIALVSSDGNSSAKAKALFQKFKDNDVKKYLNENSLNQAGYEIEIENQTMFDTLGSGNLDDYFYAFDKTDWGNSTKNLFIPNHPKQEKKVTISWDGQGNPIRTETIVNKIVDVIAYEENIDGVTAEEYKNKLISKSKSYNGGLIILADYEAKPNNLGAFSRTFPLDYNILFVYSTNSDGQTYAHEIGHMLGLEHSFITIDASKNKDDTKEYSDKKKEINDYITNTITPKKLINESEKSSNRGKTLGKQSKSTITFDQGYFVIKNTLINCIDNSNGYFDARIRDYNGQINAVNNNTNYTMPQKGPDGKWILNSDGKTLKQFPTTPPLFKERLKEQKGEFELYKQNNIACKAKIQNISHNKCFNFDSKFSLILEDTLKIYTDYLQSLMQGWQQMISNYIYFKQNSTKNMMDYTPSIYDVKTSKNIEQCIRFFHHQILIMRKDYENY